MFLCDISLLVSSVLGGLELVREQREDSYHFLVFTDLFGNRSHGVVAQFDRPALVQTHILALTKGHIRTNQCGQLILICCLLCQACQEGVLQNGHRRNSTKARFYIPFVVCVISKFPYYNALKDCLSW